MHMCTHTAVLLIEWTMSRCLNMNYVKKDSKNLSLNCKKEKCFHVLQGDEFCFLLFLPLCLVCCWSVKSPFYTLSCMQWFFTSVPCLSIMEADCLINALPIFFFKHQSSGAQLNWGICSSTTTRRAWRRSKNDMCCLGILERILGGTEKKGLLSATLTEEGSSRFYASPASQGMALSSRPQAHYCWVHLILLLLNLAHWQPKQ